MTTAHEVAVRKADESEVWDARREWRMALVDLRKRRSAKRAYRRRQRRYGKRLAQRRED